MPDRPAPGLASTGEKDTVLILAAAYGSVANAELDYEAIKARAADEGHPPAPADAKTSFIPTAFLDGDGKLLDGANRYVLRFEPGAAHQRDLVGVDVRPAGLRKRRPPAEGPPGEGNR